MPWAKDAVRHIGDTLYNLVAGLGTEKDKSTFSQFVITFLTQQQVEVAYRADWVSRKVVDCPAEDATREWRMWIADEAQVELIEACEKNLLIQRKVKQAMIKARLYGGAGIVMGVGKDDLKDELDPEKVKQGDLKFLHVMARHQLRASQLDLDVQSPGYGEPKSYTVGSMSGLNEIHPSRVVRFMGPEVPSIELSIDGWGDSALQAVDTAVKNSGLAAEGIAALIWESKIDVIKLPEFMSSIGTAEYKTRLLERMKLASTAKSMVNTLLLDKEEEWDRIEQSFAGMPDLVKLYLLIASGAAGIPATIMLGQSATGLGATGEGDTRNYYDRVSSQQKNELTPSMRNLDEVIIRSALGSRPPTVRYDWRPLWQLTELERADTELKKAQAHKIDVDNGIILEDALRIGRQNQLMESGFYPGFEEALDEATANELADVTEEDDQARREQQAERGATPEGVKPPGLDPNAPPDPNNPNAPPAPNAPANQNTPTPPFQKKKVGDRGRRARRRVDDAKPVSLYVRRDVTPACAKEIQSWALGQGFKGSDLVDGLHVTILYSRTPVDPLKMGAARGGPDGDGSSVTVAEGGPRVLEVFGPPDDRVVVLSFASCELSWRHCDMIYRGASHDYDDYSPHVTIASIGTSEDELLGNTEEKLAALEPYRGRIELGPEIFETISADGYSYAEGDEDD